MMNNVELTTKRGNTAISRQSMSRPMAKMLKASMFDNKRVLDYGCGKGFDVEQLKSLGIDITGYEPFASDKYLQVPSGKFDIITNNYVLNVIENPEERKELIILQALSHALLDYYFNESAEPQNLVKATKR